MSQSITEQLTFLYGAETAASLTAKLEAIMNRFQSEHPELAAEIGNGRFNEQDAILITYGDMVQTADATPLAALGDFLKQWLDGVVSGIHFLPFYPYSSDDGFSVIDYQAVNPDLGDWHDLSTFNNQFQLMFDAVINHISAKSDWFQGYLQGDPAYQDFFIEVDPTADLTAVFRPRALPLLTPFETAVGIRYIWTTFSPDQIDLNYANPAVLLAVLETLLFYVAKGARYLRLDAIGFMWKEIGTSCLNLPQTHRLIQLIRAVLDEVAPQVAIITETNIPHKDNISYFGNGRNEAQLVYNFTLPPLTLHAFHSGNAETLSRWAKTLTLPSDEVTFFNFLASHDGIGLTPVRDILDETAVAHMAARVEALGGYVSYKSNGDGSKNAYELNINYLDALGDPDAPDEDVETITRRFLASQAIMLALRGVPGIYFHSLFGSRGWREGAEANGRSRTINRQKLTCIDLERELNDPQSLRHHLFNEYKKMLQARTSHAAFHPNGEQEILALHKAVFALWRRSPNGRSQLLCLHNVSKEAVTVSISAEQSLTDILDGRVYEVGNGRLRVTLRPYGVCWLQ
jgi:glucosylglycerate phosphorylase